MGDSVLDFHSTYTAWMFFDFAYSRENGTKEKTVRVEQTPFIRFYPCLDTFYPV